MVCSTTVCDSWNRSTVTKKCRSVSKTATLLADRDLSLPKMLSGANTFEISDFQEDEIEGG